MKKENLYHGYDTVTEAIKDLQKKGYNTDFNLLSEEECLICHKTKVCLSPEEFEIDGVYRFEGDTDPGDEIILFAISSPANNLKGTLINAFGAYSDAEASAIVKYLNKHI